MGGVSCEISILFNIFDDKCFLRYLFCDNEYYMVRGRAPSDPGTVDGEYG